jgi:3-methyladenine DNA glycosylase AlkD
VIRLVERIRRELAHHSDAERAERQEAYMRSAMPYRGLRLPEVRQLTTAALREDPIDSQEALVATVTSLWDGAAYREERYAALAVLQDRTHRQLRDVRLLPLYDHLVVTGGWWDVVDDLCTHALRELLIAHPAEVAPTIRHWAQDEYLWRRRAALVCQVGAKGATDTALLSDVILSALSPPDELSHDFFVRKGIGWALRDYAKTDPAWVRAFVRTHRHQLSPLSIREATKHLGGPEATGE